MDGWMNKIAWVSGDGWQLSRMNGWMDLSMDVWIFGRLDWLINIFLSDWLNQPALHWAERLRSGLSQEKSFRWHKTAVRWREHRLWRAIWERSDADDAGDDLLSLFLPFASSKTSLMSWRFSGYMMVILAKFPSPGLCYKSLLFIHEASWNVKTQMIYHTRLLTDCGGCRWPASSFLNDSIVYTHKKHLFIFTDAEKWFQVTTHCLSFLCKPHISL